MAGNQADTPPLINSRLSAESASEKRLSSSNSRRRLSQQQKLSLTSSGSPTNSPFNETFEEDETNIFRYDDDIREEELARNETGKIEEEGDDSPPKSPTPIPKPRATIVQQKPPALFTNARQQQQQLHPPQPIPLRDPTLSETIQCLMHWSGLVRSNAAAHLAHLCFAGGDSVKVEARGAIPLLVELLLEDNDEHESAPQPPLSSSVTRHQQYKTICSALRNLTCGYDDDIDENKRALLQAGGITALGRLYAHTYTIVQPQQILTVQRGVAENRGESGNIVVVAEELCEIVSAILWNLSGSAEIQKPIVDEALPAILGTITDLPSTIIALLQKQAEQTNENAPYELNRINQSQRNQNLRYYNQQLLRQFQTKTFRNVSGVLRNVSSVDEQAVRKALRGGDDGGVLLRAVFAYLRIVCVTAGDDVEENVAGSGIINSKATENCVCFVRNISFRLQEIDDDTFTEQLFRDGVGEVVYSRRNHHHHVIPSSIGKKNVQKTTSNTSNSLVEVGDDDDYDDILGPDVICVLRKPKTRKQKAELTTTLGDVLPSAGAARQVDMLWSNEAVKCYLSILRQCTNPYTLEAAAATIQNLTACAWRPTLHVRAIVRKEKGLPVLIELLRMDNDRVVMSVARALRNLALDDKNRDLIGKYAMNDLMAKIPSVQQQQRPGGSQTAATNSDETVAAILATLNETIASSQEFARIFVEHDGLAKLVRIAQQPKELAPFYGPKTVRFATYILHTLWRRHVKLRDLYKTFGFKESQLLAVSRKEQQPSAVDLQRATAQRRRQKNTEKLDEENKQESSSLLAIANEFRRHASAEAALTEAAAIAAAETGANNGHIATALEDVSQQHNAPSTRHHYAMATTP